jgi:hypothetical protein
MGAGQGMSRLSRAPVADGHTAIGMESPGSPRLFQAAQEAGLKLVPLPVDDDGLVVGALDGQPGLRAACVGAARQVALGVPLAPHRRLALVDWARRVDGLVIEDDYLSEFSYDHPAPPEPSDPGLLIGYGNLKDSVIDAAVTTLAEIIHNGAGSDEFDRGGASDRYDRSQDLHA